jgi:GT2 family glycosyltransferase
MRLPTPPSVEELAAHTPRITPLSADGGSRPLWSVMIPTYNSGDYFRRTLTSVLQQDLGPEKMQIEVVDGGSTKDDPERVVKELGQGRVEWYRLPENRGPAHTFNVCIQRARGRWVHILHGDDVVLPGFFQAYEAMMHAHPQARMVIGQHVKIDEEDRWIEVNGHLPPAGGGIVADFTERHATQIRVMCPAVVVSRAAYEEVGGFCTLFESCTDWDMWFRVSLLGPVVSVGRPFALYRRHVASQTGRLLVSATNIREAYYAVSSNLARMKGRSLPPGEQFWRSRLADLASGEAWFLDSRNSTEGRYNQALWAWKLDPTIRRFWMLVRSWLKHRLARSRGPATSPNP